MKYSVTYGLKGQGSSSEVIHAKSLLAAENYARIKAINMYDELSEYGGPILTPEMIQKDEYLASGNFVPLEMCSEEYFDRREAAIISSAESVEA